MSSYIYTKKRRPGSRLKIDELSGNLHKKLKIWGKNEK